MAIVKGAKDFLELLYEQGIIPETTRRVIIDAEVGNALKVYVEQYGDVKILDLVALPEFKAAITLAVREHNA